MSAQKSVKMSAKRIAERFWNEQRTQMAETSFWSTGLLILSSAALGGIAVALWNRKALTSIRAFGDADPADGQLELDLRPRSSDEELS